MMAVFRGRKFDPLQPYGVDGYAMNHQKQWEKVYSARPAEQLGWYETHLQASLNCIRGLGLAEDASIIDVGGGASTLVDDLLDEGYRAITVLDISEKALASVKARLGEKAGPGWKALENYNRKADKS